jgi:uncharacterized repeat protein (TIGR01451 family)
MQLRRQEMKRGLIGRVRGTRRRLGIAAVALVAVVAIVLPAAASAPLVTTNISALIGTSGTVLTVTYGQTAAWSVTVKNTGGNTINHVTLIDAVDSGTVLGTDNAACKVTKGSTSSFTCAVGQLVVGQSFTARFAFTAPASSTTGVMTNTLSGTFDPQTPNGTNNRDTDTIPPSTNPAQLVAINPAAISTYGLPNVNDGVIHTDALSLTHKQFTQVDLPSTLTSGFGTPVQLSEVAGAGSCATCVPYQSVITIPDSEPGSLNPNPFTSSTPFTWSIQVDGTLLPNGFKPAGIYHNGALLPFCSVQPITTVPICVLTLSQDKKTKTVYATGLATTNGSYQFG